MCALSIQYKFSVSGGSPTEDQHYGTAAVGTPAGEKLVLYVNTPCMSWSIMHHASNL